MITKEDIQNRINELKNALQQQQTLVAQVNNNILMIHGGIEEMGVQLRKIEEKEKLEAEAKEKERLEAEEKAKKEAEANGECPATPDAA